MLLSTWCKLTLCLGILETVQLSPQAGKRATLSPINDEEEANVDEESLKSLRNLALKSYLAVKSEVSDGGLLISPLSLSGALGMLLLGARGKTLDSLTKGLEIPKESLEKYHNVLASVQTRLSRLQKAVAVIEEAVVSDHNDDDQREATERGVVVKIANEIFVKEGENENLRETFTNGLERYYSAKCRVLDFEGKPTESVHDINKWVENSTDGSIDKILSENDINEDTSMVLANAVYFKGSWKHAFRASATKVKPFYSTEEVQKVEMMHQRQFFRVAHLEGTDARAIELPYIGNNLSMVVILPNKRGSFGRVEEALKSNGLNLVFAALSDSKQNMVVDLELPKFSADYALDLKGPLTKLGLGSIFGNAKDTPDFSGISEKEKLFVSEMLHKSLLVVNEEGSKASAATAIVVMVNRSLRPKLRRSVQFHANHPFLFLIKENINDVVIFIGSFQGPREESSEKRKVMIDDEERKVNVDS